MCDSYEFLINSGDRTSGNTSDYKIEMRTDSIKLPSGKPPSKCKIVGINFNNGLYNVNNTNQNLLIYEATAVGNTTVTIPAGQYNATQLANQLQTSLNAATKVSNTYTVSYNAQTYFMTITANTETFNFVNPSLLLGMMNNSTTSLTQTSSQAIKIFYDFLYVTCDLIGDIKNTSQNNTPGSFTIPLMCVDIGTAAYFGRETLPLIEHTFVPRNNFTVKIYDQFGNLASLNNTDHQFTLQLY